MHPTAVPASPPLSLDPLTSASSHTSVLVMDSSGTAEGSADSPASSDSSSSSEEGSEFEDEADLVEDLFHPQRLIRRKRKRIARQMECSQKCVTQSLVGCIPALTWLPRYSPRKDLITDVVAGLILAIVAVPQGMAYALLAGLPPIYGLYSCLVPPAVYAILGGSREMHIGPVALLSLLVANALAELTPLSSTPDAYRQDLAVMLSIMSGIVLIATSAMRLGFAVSFLSDSVLSAYNCASAYLILTSQLPSFLGLHPPPNQGFVEAYIHIFSSFGEMHPMSLLLGCLSVGVLLVVDAGNARFQPRIPLPGQLVVVVLGTVLTYVAGLDGAPYNVKVIGFIPSGLPRFSLPGADTSRYQVALPPIASNSSAAEQQAALDASLLDPSLQLLSFPTIRSLVQPACMLALISYIITISIAKDFATRSNEARSKAMQAREKAAVDAKAAVEAGMPPSAAVVVGSSASGAAGAMANPSASGITIAAEVIVDPNQELLALGLCNLLGGFVQCYPSGGALSRSLLVRNVGVRSSLHNIVSVFALMMVLLFLTPLLHYLPFSVLAAIVFVALKSLLLQVSEGVRLFHLRKSDFLQWGFTFGATLMFDTQTGISAGVVTSLLMLLKQTSRPPVATLGRLAHTDLYRNVRHYPLAHTYRGILAFRFDAPLHFSNKDFFRAQLSKHMKRAQEREFKMHRRAASTNSTLAGGARTPRMQRLKARWGHMGAQARAIARNVAVKLALLPHPSHHPPVAAVAAEVAELNTTGGGMLSSRAQRRLSQSLPRSLLDDMRATQIHEGANMSRSLSLDQTDPGLKAQQEAELISAAQAVVDEVVTEAMEEKEAAEAAENLAVGADDADDANDDDAAVELSLSDCAIRYVVLDCSSLVDADDAALRMLASLPSQLEVQFLYCGLNKAMQDLLLRLHMLRPQEPTPPAAAAASAVVHAHPALLGQSSPDLEAPVCLDRPFASVHEAVKTLVELRLKHEAVLKAQRRAEMQMQQQRR